MSFIIKMETYEESYFAQAINALSGMETWIRNVRTEVINNNCIAEFQKGRGIELFHELLDSCHFYFEEDGGDHGAMLAEAMRNEAMRDAQNEPPPNLVISNVVALAEEQEQEEQEQEQEEYIEDLEEVEEGEEEEEEDLEDGIEVDEDEECKICLLDLSLPCEIQQTSFEVAPSYMHLMDCNHIFHLYR